MLMMLVCPFAKLITGSKLLDLLAGPKVRKSEREVERTPS